MNPLKITLANARTFDHVELEIPEGLLAILGSNGAGKSTLISAIDIALFGPDGRSLAPWYPRGGGSDPMTIELVFEHASELYRVRRSYSPKGRGQSKLDLEQCSMEPPWGPVLPTDWEPLTLESQTATQERLESLIGLSRSTFRASSYLAQGDSGAFCDAVPSARKAILAEVIGLADWDRYLERARREKRACELEMAEGQALVERADAELLQREGIADDRVAAAMREQEHRTAHAQAVEELTTARESLSEAMQAGERREAASLAQRRAEASVADLQRAIQTREDEIKGIDSRLAGREALVDKATSLETLETSRDRLQASVAQWQERQRLERELAESSKRIGAGVARITALGEQANAVLAGIGKEHCDRCGQVLGEEAATRAFDSYVEEGKRASEEVTALNEREQELLAALASTPADEPDETVLASLYDEIRRAQEAQTRLAALDEAAARRDVASSELDTLRAELPTRDRAAAGALAEMEALGPHDPNEVQQAKFAMQKAALAEQQLREKIEFEVREVARCDERLERLAKIEDEAVAQRARVESLSGLLGKLSAMERACSANGIPALILESIAIPQVEVEASRVLRALGGPATAVELRTLRELKSAGIADTLDIVLQTDTGEAAYEQFSGGEKARIAFSLRLALAQLLAARKGSDTGLLVIDEIDGLDTEGIAALVSVLEELPAKVPRIIVVSHQAELRDAFAQSLTIENIDGRSRILEPAVTE